MKALKDALGFSVAPKMKRLISINGFHAAIMRAEKKEKDNDGLPTGIPIPIMPVDYLKEHPKNWVPGEGSYVIPVHPEWGLWFNWTMNDPARTAVLASVKGLNPITGERVSGYGIKKIEDKCPIHDEKFKQGHFCEKCNYKWPAQNYVSDPTPMYMDGFRQPDGTVRQFYFTEEMSKSIPELVIGKEDTVPAFGFCFYRPMEAITYPEPGNRYKNEFPKSNNIFNSYREFWDFGGTHERSIPATYKCSLGEVKTSNSSSEVSAFYSSSEPTRGKIAKTRSKSMGILRSMEASLDAIGEVNNEYNSGDLMCPPPSKEVGVGAGAKIDQEIKNDTRDVTYWKEKPSAVIRLYFVFQDEFSYYVSKGLRNIEGDKEGYLSGLPVGGSNE